VRQAAKPSVSPEMDGFSILEFGLERNAGLSINRTLSATAL
jgi:hypothetical protein